jgi:opacity protein-like surface antigen
MPLKKVLMLFFLMAGFTVSAQIGGESTYQFLTLTNSARMAALGGIQVAVNDSSDLNLAFCNPALLRNSASGLLTVNYVSYLAGINYGYASYGFSLGSYGNLATGIHYINYGNFEAADADGTRTGNSFTAGEYALNIIWSKQFSRWYVGANLKPIYSVFESYHSYGIAGDIGVSHISRSSRSSVGLVIRNIGAQLTSYYEGGDRESIPFEILAGFSQKLAHAPLILSVTAQQLNHWNLAKAEDTSAQDLFSTGPSESFGKQFMRHVLLGVEILPSEHFTIRAGYNYNLRQQLKVDQKVSTVGFSLGFGVKIKRFRFDYSNTRFHIAGSSNLISLAFNLNRNYF